MYVCVWSGVWGVDGVWMPLPTRPQRYCDSVSLIIFSAENSSRVFKKITVMAIAPQLIPTNLPKPQLPSAMATIARKLSTKLHLRYPGRISQKENASASASIVASFLYDTEIFRLSKRPTFSIRWSRIHICKEESLAPTSCQTSTPWA